MARTVEVTELLLREAQQSLLETSMALDDLVPVCEDLDNAGYWSLECWGGTAFHSSLRFLNEDPWERLRTYRKLLPKTRLQMLLRGQNLVAHRNFDDSIVSRFVEKAALNGMDVFRLYDALNDIRNLKAGVEAVKKAGKHAQGAICYSPGPIDTIAAFVDLHSKLRNWVAIPSACRTLTVCSNRRRPTIWSKESSKAVATTPWSASTPIRRRGSPWCR